MGSQPVVEASGVTSRIVAAVTNEYGGHIDGLS